MRKAKIGGAGREQSRVLGIKDPENILHKNCQKKVGREGEGVIMVSPAPRGNEGWTGEGGGQLALLFPPMSSPFYQQLSKNPFFPHFFW